MYYQAKTVRLIILLFLSGLALGLSGCSSHSRLKDPDIHLVDVEVVRAKLLEQRFLLSFRIDNPNDRSLPVSSLSYTLYLDEMKLADGESNLAFEVPAHGQHVFQVPLRTNLWGHVKPIIKRLETPDEPIRYRLQGKIKTGFLFGQTVHLRRNGEIIPGDYIPE